MFYINKYIFNEVCEKNIDIYNEFISCISIEYNNIIKILKNPKTVADIRFQTHKLLGIINNLHADELIYICKLILQIDKNNRDISIDVYKPCIKQVIEYDISRIGL